MEYTVILTQGQNREFYAAVPGIPDCHAHAKTRQEAIQSIRTAIAQFMSQSEIIRVDVSVPSQANVVRETTPWEWFGAFQHENSWGALFDHIEQIRDADHQHVYGECAEHSD